MGAETAFRDNSCCVVQDFVSTERVGIIHLRVCDKQGYGGAGVSRWEQQNLSLVKRVCSRLL